MSGSGPESDRHDETARNARGWSLTSTCRAFAAMYLALAIGHTFALDGRSASVMTPLAGTSAALLFFMGEWSKRARGAEKEGISFLVAFCVLVNSLSHLALEADAHDSINVFLLLVGAAYFLRSAFLFGTLVALSLGGGAFVVWRFVPEFDSEHYGFATLLTLVLSFALFSSRRSFMNDIERLRRADQAKSDQLEDALGQARDELDKRKELVRNLESADARNAAIIELASSAVFLIDEQERITQANSAATRIFGFRRSSLIGRRLTDTIVPREAESASVDTQESTRVERSIVTTGRHADGREIPVEVIVQKVSAPHERPAFAAFLNDLTDRQRVEEELRDALDRAEDGSRAKTQFLARMSHEIRTPLNAIVGLTDLALTDLPSGRARELLERSRGAGRYLSAMLGDLLDLAKVEADRLEVDLRPVALRPLLEDACSFLSVRAAERGLDLILEVEEDVPTRVFGDSTRIRQIVTNLVGNALKFTKRGWVRVAMQLDGDQVRIDVEDTGIGVAPEMRTRIFDEFEQGEGIAESGFGGSGLGLAISRRLADLMGGRIEYRPRREQGSVFSLVVPNRRASVTPQQADLTEARVVLALPNPRERRAVERNLAPHGPEIDMAEDMTSLKALLNETTASPAAAGTKILFDIEAFPLSICPAPSFEWIAVVRSPATDVPPFVSSLLTRPLGPRSLLRAIRADEPEPEDLSVTMAEARLPASRFLVVEDNEINQIVLAETLRRRGHRVDVASSGPEALELQARENYDAVLLDLEMPEMNGFETLEHLRTRDGGETLPVIAVTAYATQDMRERTIAGGFNAFVSKPIRLEELLEVLEQQLPAGSSNHEPRRVESAPPRPPAIDRETLLRHAEGDVSIVRKLAEIFERRGPELIEQVRAACKESDTERLRAALHKTRGTLGDIGANDALATAERMSALARADGTSRVQGLLGQLQREIEVAVAELSEFARTAE